MATGTMRERLAAAMEANKGLDPLPIGDCILEALQRPATEGMGVADRLVRKFGYGQAPGKRRELYVRLERLCKEHGEKGLEVISHAVAQAVGARDPARYFCWVVTRMVREAGLSWSKDSGRDATW